MGFKATVLLDSVSPVGIRLTTLEIVLPRVVLAELNTHRVFSRNSASSRAIPVEKMLAKVMGDPFVPANFGKNQAGMQAGQDLNPEEQTWARVEWLLARDMAVDQAKALMHIGVHKQLTNRLLEPFMWHTVIISATEWSNFYALRCHPDAQPEIQTVAVMMREAMVASTPVEVACGEWHLPLVPDLAELRLTYGIEDVKRVSAGRCARVSYLTHHGERDPQADIDLCNKLATAGHMSPLEHVAQASPYIAFFGNFKGWKQMRRDVPNEQDFSLTEVPDVR